MGPVYACQLLRSVLLLVKIGDPGELSAGGLARDHKGLWQFGFVRKLGWGSILKAEIWAIFMGLQCAWDRGYRSVIIESDSLLAVTKIPGEVHRQDPFYTLITKCQQLLRLNWNCNLTHIFREANYCADFLASLAMSFDFSITILDSK